MHESSIIDLCEKEDQVLGTRDAYCVLCFLNPVVNLWNSGYSFQTASKCALFLPVTGPRCLRYSSGCKPLNVTLSFLAIFASQYVCFLFLISWYVQNLEAGGIFPQQSTALANQWSCSPIGDTKGFPFGDVLLNRQCIRQKQCERGADCDECLSCSVSSTQKSF